MGRLLVYVRHAWGIFQSYLHESKKIHKYLTIAPGIIGLLLLGQEGTNIDAYVQSVKGCGFKEINCQRLSVLQGGLGK